MSTGFPWCVLMNSLPGTAELSRRTETRAFGDIFHVELRLAKQFLCVCDAQPVAVLGDRHADMVVEKTRKVSVARARHAGECAQTPRLGKVCGNRVLHAMHRRVNVVTTFQPRRELWIRAAPAQINN